MLIPSTIILWYGKHCGIIIAVNSASNMQKITFLLLLFLTIASQNVCADTLRLGAEKTEEWLQELKGKQVALVVNQTSVVGSTHLVDTMLKLKIKIKTIFAPEHGFRGDHSAGAKVNNTKDEKTGLPVISLYGSSKKPSAAMLEGVEVVVFDIQDVGVRYYTYISTLHYVMEACAELNKKVVVLDRPNPNGHFIDGPVLDMRFKSFVGMHPVPLVHGMTVGEYARMINGEKWLQAGVVCDLQVVKMNGYTHSMEYVLPIRPSPNLPTHSSVLLYPSLGLFEGTGVSSGRGTPIPFDCFGAPFVTHGNYYFVPKIVPGVADNPMHKAVSCRGYVVSSLAPQLRESPGIRLNFLILMYESAPDKSTFFNDFFDKLAGTDQLRKQIQQGMTAMQIKATWAQGIRDFEQIRAKYLLYP